MTLTNFYKKRKKKKALFSTKLTQNRMRKKAVKGSLSICCYVILSFLYAKKKLEKKSLSFSPQAT